MAEDTKQTKETQETKESSGFTITPANVNDLAARLTLLLNARHHPHPMVECMPRDDVCGIELRIFSALTSFRIKLEAEQVYALLKHAEESLESWVSTLREDLLKMTTEDGSDPRVVKPDEYKGSEPPF